VVQLEQEEQEELTHLVDEAVVLQLMYLVQLELQDEEQVEQEEMVQQEHM